MPFLLQSGSEDGPRRIRGRPRAGVSKPDETSRTEAIRAKNRRAQKAYRLRCKVCVPMCHVLILVPFLAHQVEFRVLQGMLGAAVWAHTGRIAASARTGSSFSLAEYVWGRVRERTFPSSCHNLTPFMTGCGQNWQRATRFQCLHTITTTSAEHS